MESINILGIKIHKTDRQELLKTLAGYTKGVRHHFIVTPNPEIILKSRKDEELFYILNKADLSLPDGVGLKFASLLMGKVINRFTGADLIYDLFRIAEHNRLKLAVLAWKEGLTSAQELTLQLQSKYPHLHFKAFDCERNYKKILDDRRLVENLAAFMPDMLIANFGSPWQEKILYNLQQKMPSAKIAAGVGGAIDYFSGKVKRAPKIFRQLGLEWLYRLYEQPQRWKRIYNATIIFTLKFLKWRFIQPFLYRSNVACLLYKKDAAGYKFLIVERKESPGIWQVPQGGTDGEPIEKAGRRELQEELNNHKFTIKAVYKNIYKYDFPANQAGKHGIAKKLAGFRGQKQSLVIAEFSGQDVDIHVNIWDHSGWKWADYKNLVESVEPARREATRKMLDKFKEYLHKHQR